MHSVKTSSINYSAVLRKKTAEKTRNWNGQLDYNQVNWAGSVRFDWSVICWSFVSISISISIELQDACIQCSSQLRFRLHVTVHVVQRVRTTLRHITQTRNRSASVSALPSVRTRNITPETEAVSLSEFSNSTRNCVAHQLSCTSASSKDTWTEQVTKNALNGSFELDRLVLLKTETCSPCEPHL